MEKIIKFKPGKKYICFSPCNTDAKWQFKCIARTEKTITLEGCFHTSATIRKRLYIKTAATSTNSIQEEVCKPLGNYSMAPVLHASIDSMN